MMESTAFFNAKASAADVNLFLDINPKNDVVKDFFFDGQSSALYKKELDELKDFCIGKTLEEIKTISRKDLIHETKIDGKRKSLASVGLWLVAKAIADYEGNSRYYKEQRDMVCLCFGVSKKDISAKVLTNKNFELKTLIQETMATSACGSCRSLIETIIEDTRNSHGLIKGLDHSKSRFDEKGNWIKVAGLYPGPLLIKLELLKNEWMKREKIEGQFQIEWLEIEGLHLTVKVNSTNEKIVTGLLSALTEYLKSELGVLFFLKSSV